MKGFWKKAVSIFCAAIMVIGLAAGFQTASAAAKFQDAKLGPLHVKGTKLCDKKGHTVQLRGISTRRRTL